MSEQGQNTFLSEARVLVTGASGLVGSSLVARLLSDGAVVRATLHQTKPTVSDHRIEYVTCDLTLADHCKKVTEGMRYVFHCACRSVGASAVGVNPASLITPNIVMNTELLAAAYGAGVEKFVWLGSTTAYPASGNRSVIEEEVFDGDPYPNYYFVGWEKRFMEILCKMYGEKLSPAMTTLVLRPTNIYGPHDNFEPATSRVVAALIRKVVERQQPLEIWGTGDDVRDHIYVDDVVEAILLAVEKVQCYGAFNIGTGKGSSIKEILSALLEIDSYKPTVVFNPSKPTMIPIRLVDVTKAQRILEFKAKTNLMDGLKNTLEWYRRQHAGRRFEHLTESA